MSTRQIYKPLARYRTDRRVTAQLHRRAISRRKRLPEQVEAIIAATLREQWLTLEAPPLAPVVDEVRARCEEAGLTLPSYLTVARRIPALFSPEEIAKKRSANPKHLLRLKPRPGYIHAPHPLAVCQIDHTPTDINFVEVVDGAGVFVGRPYLTIITDVATRSILGFCLTLEKPSVLSVALCLAQDRGDDRQQRQRRGMFEGLKLWRGAAAEEQPDRLRRPSDMERAVDRYARAYDAAGRNHRDGLAITSGAPAYVGNKIGGFGERQASALSRVCC